MEIAMGGTDAVLQVSRDDQESDLHDERDRVAQFLRQEDHEEPAEFPDDYAAMKLVFMALQNISKRWTMPIRDWGAAMNQFAILYGDRVPL